MILPVQRASQATLIQTNKTMSSVMNTFRPLRALCSARHALSS